MIYYRHHCLYVYINIMLCICSARILVHKEPNTEHFIKTHTHTHTKRFVN
ncbi:Uncharacterized protein APZ42_032588 [Daphnia magna]|uniref:Uncharacterized protein n=1 Tax=Daphnia magna TaxID=35525 RepID=A0A164LP32_9CRUS|nr:Uncharacterized protein APZ42_032588 [Daphnia magna]